MSGHLWLVGMMGSGKSAVGRHLAERSGSRFFDTDEEVAARTGCSIAQLWGERGEEAFRGMEAAAVARLAAGERSVVATGGGVVLDSSNVETMRSSGLVVWLTAEPRTLAARVGSGFTRPLLEEEVSEERLGGILDARRSRYEDAADAVVDTEDVAIADVATRIEELWNES